MCPIHPLEPIPRKQPRRNGSNQRHRFKPCKISWFKMCSSICTKAIFRLAGLVGNSDRHSSNTMCTISRLRGASTNTRSSKTSFKCFTHNNHSDVPDTVTVIPDGVLGIVKWKLASKAPMQKEERTIEWNKQPVCVAFEVPPPFSQLRN